MLADNSPLEWRDNVDAATWDQALVTLGGHPLQSALWGDARRKSDGIRDRRWMALRQGAPIWLARIEERPVAGCGWVGWVPRGPTSDVSEIGDLPTVLKAVLRKEGMLLLVSDRWNTSAAAERRGTSGPRTVWVDLTCGLDVLYKKLDKLRYGVGRARRERVIVNAVASDSDVERFFSMCETVAETKDFKLDESIALLRALLTSTRESIESRLFLARLDGVILAGAFIIRCGRSLHYFWGATDRSAARVRAAEAVQWAVLEWGVAQGCTRYDLEGIDPIGNPGTYAFKKKMGGEEVALAGKHYYPLGLRGRALAWMDRKFR
jgi:hypothetical protein